MVSYRRWIALLWMALLLCSMTPEVRGEASATAEKRLTNGVRLVLLPGGSFLMGSPATDSHHLPNETPRHLVRMGGFWLGSTEVTNAQYCEFLNAEGNLVQGGEFWMNLPHPDCQVEMRGELFVPKTGREDHPALLVTWYGATAYCRWLSAKTDLDIRLPTEAQWEYACRAGTTTRFHSGDAETSLQGHANVADYYLEHNREELPFDKEWWPHCPKLYDGYSWTAPVGTRKPNAWGLHDMHGNVWEWCSDRYGEAYFQESPPRDPHGPKEGSTRVTRGGGWCIEPKHARSANRVGAAPEHSDSGLGFRIACPGQTAGAEMSRQGGP